jgi:hypothetical protein
VKTSITGEPVLLEPITISPPTKTTKLFTKRPAIFKIHYYNNGITWFGIDEIRMT